jgi:hypothetical protein
MFRSNMLSRFILGNKIVERNSENLFRSQKKLI